MKYCHTSNSCSPSPVVPSLQPNLNATTQRAPALNFLYLFSISCHHLVLRCVLCFVTNEFCSKSRVSHEQQVYTILSGKCCLCASRLGLESMWNIWPDVLYIIHLCKTKFWKWMTQLLACLSLDFLLLCFIQRQVLDQSLWNCSVSVKRPSVQVFDQLLFIHNWAWFFTERSMFTLHVLIDFLINTNQIKPDLMRQ